jgi:hypothetical protein
VDTGKEEVTVTIVVNGGFFRGAKAVTLKEALRLKTTKKIKFILALFIKHPPSEIL